MKSDMTPILFNTDMVRGLLNGTKTVTRRVALPAKDLRPFPAKGYPNGWWFRGRAYPDWDNVMRSPQGVMSLCRYRPGDILYVRETWAKYMEMDSAKTVWLYKADNPVKRIYDDNEMLCDDQRIRWCPSTQMPREAARIFLRVTDVRAERLQEIDGRGILAEGIDNGNSNPAMGKRWENMQRMVFQGLWDSTIKPADRALYGWEANPLVWVIEFERITKEEAERT